MDDFQVDVLVVGAGNAAACAALAAREKGATVAMLEAAPEAERGGNSTYTAGAMRVVFNGVKDLVQLYDLTPDEQRDVDFGSYSADEFLDDMGRVTNYRCDPELTDILIGRSFETLKWMRTKGDSAAVLVISARDAVPDRVAGLNMGADDYLTKPFDLDEVLARVHALARRRGGRAEPELQLGRLVLRPQRREALLDNQQVVLAAREYDLLLALMERPGTVLSREQLENRLYGWHDEVSSNAVEVHVHHLRRKLGPAWIKNVRGVGYKLVAIE